MPNEGPADKVAPPPRGRVALSGPEQHDRDRRLGNGRLEGGRVDGHPLPRPHQIFHVLPDTPCPYLPGRWERKLVTEVYGRNAGHLYSRLSRAGFRRSHHFAYRPACSGCDACVPVRVCVADFAPNQSLRRVARRNADLAAGFRPPSASAEQYELFARYLGARHADGEMAGMTFADYRAMVEDTSLASSVLELREAGDPPGDRRGGRLLAACLVDWLEDGASAVYSFFEPGEERRSLGKYCVLALIEEARRRALPYVYLGYWIAESPKMAYKARFRPLEGLVGGRWRRLRD